jgi:DNA-binding beta-propeller fold protein YncE
MRGKLLITIVLFFLMSLSYAVLQAEPTENENTLELGYTIDINEFGSRIGSSIAVDNQTGHLYVSITNMGIAEFSPEGQLLNTFTIPIPRVDNSGLSHDPLSGNLLFVNGWGNTNLEPIITMSITGTVVSQISSPILEGTGLAIDPLSGNLFVSDVVNTVSHVVKELQLQEGAYVVVNSFALPTILTYADAGLDFNPATGNLAIGGAFGQNPGVIFDVSRDGSIIQEYLDTEVPNGITGLAFDDDPFRLYVLDGYRKQILVYGNFHTVYLPIMTNN